MEWFKDGVKIVSEPNRRIYSNNNVYYLRINDANPKTTDGVYTFKVKDIETSGTVTIEGSNFRKVYINQNRYISIFIFFIYIRL